jgi:lysylphosphatidylglycerol synthetase-like protein (DUF2156 family)
MLAKRFLAQVLLHLKPLYVMSFSQASPSIAMAAILLIVRISLRAIHPIILAASIGILCTILTVIRTTRLNAIVLAILHVQLLIAFPAVSPCTVSIAMHLIGSPVF